MPRKKTTLSYAERKAARMCTKRNCDRPLAEGSNTYCEKHRTEAKDRAAGQRKKRQDAGLCTVAGCDQPLAPHSNWKCVAHLAEGSAAQQKKFKANVAAGLCGDCGGKHGPKVPDSDWCEHCYAKRLVSNNVTHAKHVAKGVCRYYNCFNVPTPPHVLCEKHRQEDREYKAQIRLEALNAYGGPVCSYPGCGQTDLDFLVLDHIDGNGCADRKERGCSGHPFFQQLKAEGFPPGFRVLCENHNRKVFKEKIREAGGFAALIRQQQEAWQRRLADKAAATAVKTTDGAQDTAD